MSRLLINRSWEPVQGVGGAAAGEGIGGVGGGLKKWGSKKKVGEQNSQ